MKRRASNIEVKKLNRNRVFRYVNSREKTSMPDIAAALGLSVPTVLQMVKELKEANIVQEAGEFESTGGRKAKAIVSMQDTRYAVGIDITRNHVSLVLTDLSEKILKHTRIRKPFMLEEPYFWQLAGLLEDFIQESHILKDNIVGVGISIPGIVDSGQNYISYSHVLNIQDVSWEPFLRNISYPCVMLNDANAAAMTECMNRRSGNMIYLSLSNTVGGAIIFRPELDGLSRPDWILGNMYIGNHWRGGEFGHIIIHPEGSHCYCGKRGCLDAYCSALRLAEFSDGNLELYFQKMESGNEQYQKMWEEYLDHLAIAVDNLRMCFDCDIVLGGYVGSFMKPYMKRFQKKVAQKNIFGNTGEYVRTCKYLVEASALGAAIYLIEKYIESI